MKVAQTDASIQSSLTSHVTCIHVLTWYFGLGCATAGTKQYVLYKGDFYGNDMSNSGQAADSEQTCMDRCTAAGGTGGCIVAEYVSGTCYLKVGTCSNPCRLHQKLLMQPNAIPRDGNIWSPPRSKHIICMVTAIYQMAIPYTTI